MTKSETETEQPPAETERPPDPQEEHDPKAVNPFYQGARFSEVARAVASPTDPEVRERIRRMGKRDRGPRPDRTPNSR